MPVKARFVDSDTGETGLDVVPVPEGISLQMYDRTPDSIHYTSIILSPEQARSLGRALIQLMEEA